MTELKNIQIEKLSREEPKPKSALTPMGKRYPELKDPLRKCRHFIFNGKTRLSLEEYLAKFFRVSRRRKDRLTIITLKHLIFHKD
ncbi:MAG: hypothetical protein ACXVPQ_02525 [Bacteroidia bacterium]